MARRARAQILPLFLFVQLFMVAIAALLIDGAGVIMASQDFDALTWRTAHFAAARASLDCAAATYRPGDDCGLSGASQADISADVAAYAGFWTSSGPHGTGMPTKIKDLALVYGTSTVEVTLTGCYSPFLLDTIIRVLGATSVAAPPCDAGQVLMRSSSLARVVLSN